MLNEDKVRTMLVKIDAIAIQTDKEKGWQVTPDDNIVKGMVYALKWVMEQESDKEFEYHVVYGADFNKVATDAILHNILNLE